MAKKAKFVIAMDHHKLRDYDPGYMYWSNDHGWAALEWASVFTEAETKTMNLPFDGRWVQLPS